MGTRSLALAALLVLSGTAFAGRDQWTTTGPPGGAQIIAADPVTPSVVYALGGDLFKSTDGGLTWKTTNLYLAYPYRVAIALSNPSVLYVGSLAGQVKKSLDRGKTWAAIDSGLPTDAIEAIAIDPMDAATAYFGTNGSGMFKTTDGGTSWAAVEVGLPDESQVTAIAVDPKDASILYVSAFYTGLGTIPDGVFKSTNAGATWTRQPGGTPLATAIVVDPFDSRVVYEIGYGTVEKSIDGGATWQETSAGLPVNFDAVSLALDPVHRGTLYLGLFGDQVFKSEDGGTSWSPVNSGVVAYSSTSVAVTADGSAVLLGDSARVARSTDGGLTWPTSDVGLWAGATVTVDSLNRVLAGTGSGLFRLQVDRDWTNVEISGVTAPSVGIIAIARSNPDVLFAHVVGDYGGSDGDGIYKSSDGGTTWALAFSTAGGSTRAIVIDPTNPQIAYAANEFLGHGVDPTNVDWIARSQDGGATWSSPDSNSVTAFCMAVDPRSPSIVYAGGLGVFRSSDYGAHWTALPTPLASGYVFAIAIDPRDSTKIYAALGAFTTPQFGVMKSADGGGHWVLHSQGLPNDTLTSLAIDPLHQNVLYAGSSANGVFRSDDDGETWTPFDPGLSNPGIGTLTFNATGLRLLAGTTAGVYEISPVSITAVSPPHVAPIVGRPVER